MLHPRRLPHQRWIKWRLLPPDCNGLIRYVILSSPARFLTRFQVYSDENDVLLWEHSFFPSFRVSSLWVMVGGEAVEITVGQVSKIDDQYYFVCEIECRPQNRKYVCISRTIRMNNIACRYSVFGVIGFYNPDKTWTWDDGISPAVAATKVQNSVPDVPKSVWADVRAILKKDNAILVYVLFFACIYAFFRIISCENHANFNAGLSLSGCTQSSSS